MYSYLEKQFVDQCSVYLERFRWANGNRVANFRCPICGDSDKSQRKARGYLYVSPKDNRFSYSCKNCGVSMRFTTFMKKQFPSIYSEYKLERLKELGGSSKPKKEDEEKKLQELAAQTQAKLSVISRKEEVFVPVSTLPDDHEAVLYLLDRQIPRKAWGRVFYTSNYKELVNKTFPYNDKVIPSDSRLVFELINKRGVLYGVQGRSLDPNCEQRYITIKFDESEPSLWGLNDVDEGLPVFVLEGIIDALLIPNSVAILGGDMTTATKLLKSYDTYMALDNEPRHNDTVARMRKVINEGLKLCFWKIDPKFKDVNDMIKKGGYTTREIVEHIINNSYKGSRAMLELTYWNKTGSSQGAKGGKSYEY